jgi:hypothetical protein
VIFWVFLTLIVTGSNHGEQVSLAAKIAAYTCRQYLNSGLGRPLRHLVDLLV